MVCMEIRSFLAGVLCLYAVETLLPVFGIKISVITPAPWFNVAAAIIALVVAYYLFRN